MDQRLSVRPIAGNPRKGSGAAEGLVSREGAHFLGCDRCIWNEGLWTSCNSGYLGLNNSVEFHNIACG